MQKVQERKKVKKSHGFLVLSTGWAVILFVDWYRKFTSNRFSGKWFENVKFEAFGRHDREDTQDIGYRDIEPFLKLEYATLCEYI